jgi:hypothetical protein
MNSHLARSVWPTSFGGLDTSPGLGRSVSFISAKSTYVKYL